MFLCFYFNSFFRRFPPLPINKFYYLLFSYTSREWYTIDSIYRCSSLCSLFPKVKNFPQFHLYGFSIGPLLFTRWITRPQSVWQNRFGKSESRWKRFIVLAISDACSPVNLCRRKFPVRSARELICRRKRVSRARGELITLGQVHISLVVAAPDEPTPLCLSLSPIHMRAAWSIVARPNSRWKEGWEGQRERRRNRM